MKNGSYYPSLPYRVYIKCWLPSDGADNVVWGTINVSRTCSLKCASSSGGISSLEVIRCRYLQLAPPSGTKARLSDVMTLLLLFLGDSNSLSKGENFNECMSSSTSGIVSCFQMGMCQTCEIEQFYRDVDQITVLVSFWEKPNLYSIIWDGLKSTVGYYQPP